MAYKDERDTKEHANRIVEDKPIGKIHGAVAAPDIDPPAPPAVNTLEQAALRDSVRKAYDDSVALTATISHIMDRL